MKTIFRFRVLAVVLGLLTALAAPVRGDVISDLRRCDHVWVDRMAVSLSFPFPSPRPREGVCDLLRKPAGSLAILVNPRNLGLRPADVWVRMNGTVQPGGWIRWTVDPSTVPATIAGTTVNSLTGSIDTDVRAIGPTDDECGGLPRTYRVRLELRPNAAGNRLVLDARMPFSPVTVTVTEFAAELATPGRGALTLSSVTLASSSVRAVAGLPTRVSGTVWVTGEPEERTYDVTLTARGTPANAGIRIDPMSMRFTGATRSQPFTLTAPAGYYGAIEVTATGGDGMVRRATVRITDPNASDPPLIVPEYRRIYKWEYMPDPPPDVLRSINPARRITPVVPAQKPSVNVLPPTGKASIPTPQEPFRNKMSAAPVPQLPGKLPAKALGQK
jgi:hypothetical protein